MVLSFQLPPDEYSRGRGVAHKSFSDLDDLRLRSLLAGFWYEDVSWQGPSFSTIGGGDKSNRLDSGGIGARLTVECQTVKRTISVLWLRESPLSPRENMLRERYLHHVVTADGDHSWEGILHI